MAMLHIQANSITETQHFVQSAIDHEINRLQLALETAQRRLYTAPKLIEQVELRLQEMKKDDLHE